MVAKTKSKVEKKVEAKRATVGSCLLKWFYRVVVAGILYATFSYLDTIKVRFFPFLLLIEEEYVR